MGSFNSISALLKHDHSSEATGGPLTPQTKGTIVVIEHPKSAKRLVSTPTVLYGGNPNMELPVGEPSEPTFSFPLTPPSESGDAPLETRYILGIHFMVYIASSSTTVYAKVKVGDRVFTAQNSSGSTSGVYAYISGAIRFTTETTLEIYVWASKTGCILERAHVETTSIHRFSDKICSLFLVHAGVVSLASAARYPTTINPLALSHMEVPETTVTGSGVYKLSIVYGPTIWSNEWFKCEVAGSPNSSVTFVRVLGVVWVEA